MSTLPEKVLKAKALAERLAVLGELKFEAKPVGAVWEVSLTGHPTYTFDTAADAATLVTQMNTLCTQAIQKLKDHYTTKVTDIINGP